MATHTHGNAVFYPDPFGGSGIYLTKKEVEEGLSELNEFIEKEKEYYSGIILEYAEWYCPRKLKKIKSILSKYLLDK